MCQDESYMGKDRWEWSVWVDGPPEELDALDRVIYVSTSHIPRSSAHGEGPPYEIPP